MLNFDEALGRMLDGVRPSMSERVAVGDADGRVLARDLIASADLPGWDYSSMDGYALRSADLTGDGPWELPVRGESRTGHEPSSMEPGAACRIFTGARMPQGADCVVMQEDVVREGDRIRLAARAKAGALVRRKGEDLRAGEVAIAAGTRLGPGHLGLAASTDAPFVWVARRPVVAIVPTGDELRYSGEAAEVGRLPESGSVAIAAMARRAGAWARVAPIAPDDPAATRELIEGALRGADLLVTIGGVSVGEHDVVRPALEAAGIRIEFWRVRMKPGKPLAVGSGAGTRVLGLPGNPTSAQVTFALFGMPLLRAMQGDASPVAPRMRARLAEPVGAGSDRTEFMRARFEPGEAGWSVRPLRNQASGATTSMALADCFVIVRPDQGVLPAGAEVDVIRIADV